MNDWADDEVDRVLKMTGSVWENWAVSLRAAHKRGMVDGLKRAAEMANKRAQEWGAAAIRHEPEEMARLFIRETKYLESQ